MWVRLPPSPLLFGGVRLLAAWTGGRFQHGFISRPTPVQIRPLQPSCGWASVQQGLISPAAGCDPRTRDFVARYANGKASRPRTCDGVGSTPTLATSLIPWSSGEDAWLTSRRAMVRVHPGSLSIC